VPVGLAIYGDSAAVLALGCNRKRRCELLLGGPSTERCSDTPELPFGEWSLYSPLEGATVRKLAMLWWGLGRASLPTHLTIICRETL